MSIRSPSTTSKEHYIKTYLFLIKEAKSNKLDDIFKFIQNANVKDTTKLSYLNSIISLKKIDKNIVKGNLKDITEMRDKLAVKIEQGRNNDNLNDRQKKAMNNVTLDDLKKFVNKLESKKNDSIKDLEKYILVKLMINYPIRNDLQEILLTNHKNDLKLNKNVLYIPIQKNKDGTLALKQYKTAKSNGDIFIKIDDDIISDIKKLIKDGRKYLFASSNGKPLSSSSFSHKLNRIFMKEFNVPISSTIIRKIYLTNKYKDVLEDMAEDQKLMGHSADVQQKIYIANSDVKSDK